MGKNKCPVRYEDIVSLENICYAWRDFLPGKRSKHAVEKYAVHFIDNVVLLGDELASMSYRHGGYKSFYIYDPKRRHIHKACVRDRLLHHAVYRQLYPYFDKRFIYDSYSCRLGKGVYKALDRFEAFSRKVSKNNTRQAWVLKCDIRKFFDSIDHEILINILNEHIPDTRVQWLLHNIIDSYHGKRGTGKGLPLGNLTSQLLGNVYMDIFDHWVKHELKQKYYIRYADDFVFFSQDSELLLGFIPQIRAFLYDTLRLELHPKKIILKPVSPGLDYLGWVHFPHHSILRKKTKERMFRKLRENPKTEVFQSYLGLLGHGNTHKVEQELHNMYWLLS